MEEITDSSSSNAESNYHFNGDYSPKRSEFDDPNRVAGQFYLVKIRSSFVDSLKSEIEMVEELRREMDEARAAISSETTSIKEKLSIEGYRLWGYGYWYHGTNEQRLGHLRREIDCWQRQLHIQFPEEANDPNLAFKLAAEAKAEAKPINYDEKIEELSKRLVHGRRSIAEEKRMLREIKEIQRRKDRPDHIPQTKIPDWDSKEARLLGIHERLTSLICQLERTIKINQQYQQKKAEVEKELIPLEQKIEKINRKKATANQRILQLKTQLNAQNDFHEEYLTLLSKTKELAEKKDTVALEELSHKQVEKFMSRWNDDGLFRSTYRASISTSLHSRKLSCDGRMRNYGEKFLLYSS